MFQEWSIQGVVWTVGYFMFTFHLKTGEVVQIALENLEQFVNENRDNIVVRHKKRRGELRIEGLESQNVNV